MSGPYFGAQGEGDLFNSPSSATQTTDNDSLCLDCDLPGALCRCAFRIFQALTDPTSELPPADFDITAFGDFAITNPPAHNGALGEGSATVLQWFLHTQTPGVGEQPLFPGNDSPAPAAAPHHTQAEEAGEGLNFHPGAVSPRMGRNYDYSGTVDRLHREAEEVESLGRRDSLRPSQQAAAGYNGASESLPQIQHAASQADHQLSYHAQQAGNMPPAAAAGPAPQLPGRLPQCCLARLGNPKALKKHQRCHRKDISCATHPDVVFYKQTDYERHLLGKKHENQAYVCNAHTLTGRRCKTVITGRPDNLKRHLKTRDHMWNERQAEEYIQPYKIAHTARKAQIRASLAVEWDMAPFLYQEE